MINTVLGTLIIVVSVLGLFLFTTAPKGRHRRGPWGLQWLLWRSTKKG